MEPELPVAEPVPSQTTEEPVAPIEPPFEQNDLPIQPAQQQPAGGVRSAPEPLLVRVIEDYELSAFEHKTVRYGIAGIAVAFLALLAAVVTAYFIYQQFSEMNYANTLAEIAAKRARYDSAEASIATANQLKVLEQQLLQQRETLEIDQRPWLKFELGGERPKDADPNNGKQRLLIATAGQPIKIEVRVTNVGKTTAEHVMGTLVVQYVPKGGKPILPRKKNEILFTEGKGRDKGGLAGTAWKESTLYPNEVSQNYFSRSRWEANGTTVEDDPITPAEKSALDSGNAYILLLGEVWYADVFGVRHWTKFCEMSNPQLDLLAAKKCIAFGAVDANQQKTSSHRP